MDLQILGDKCQEYFTNLNETSYLEDHPLIALLDKYDREHPNLSSYKLKAAQYDILSENCELIVFEESPFYFINNISPKPGKYLGAATWLSKRNLHIYKDANPEVWRKFKKQQELWLFLCCGPYTDNVHFTVGMENLVKRGLEYYYLKILDAKKTAEGEELDFLLAAEHGLLAVKRISERFADIAREKLKTLKNELHRKNMQMLIEAAERSPWKAPQTFFEGLNACWIGKNVLGAMEGVGNATLGRVDYILYDLYKADLESGRLTKDEAYGLIKQFVLFGDRQYDKNETVSKGADQEEEMGFALGGCDPDGRPVFNELTEMFIKAHTELHCIYPKIHARFGTDSPEEYLKLIASEFASGRSVIGLSCDDGIIPGLLRVGKTLPDARNYETVGCWENKIPTKESMPGGNYVYALRVLEQSVYGPEAEYVDAGFECTPLDEAKNAEDVYRILRDNLVGLIKWRCEAIGKYGRLAPKANPLCLSSALMDGCIEKRKDYTAGGGTYNENSCDLAGFANYVDAILAIRELCFERGEISLKEYLDAVRSNWEGYDELLMKVRSCPHFGDNCEKSKETARRLHGDIVSALEKIESERGGKFFLNYYVYREYFRMAKEMRATPDGRRDGEYFAQGIGVARCHTKDAFTDVVQSAYCFDAASYGTSSLDLQLPYGKTHPEHIVMLLKTLAHIGAKHIQINCVSPEELIKAQKNPENYQDLIVRVTGFSAKFVSLSEEFQNELISRRIYQ